MLIDIRENRLDKPSSYILTDFHQNVINALKLRNHLTHTSGFPAQIQYYLEGLSTDEVIEKIYAQSLMYETGSKVVYSDLGFITLYKVIEVVTGKKFEQFVQSELFTPLEMFETGFNPTFPKERYAAT